MMFMDVFTEVLSQIASPERLEMAMIAMVVSAVIGGLIGPVSGQANPPVWGLLDRILGDFSRKTYNTQRSVASLRFRGGILLVFYLALTLAAALVVMYGVQVMPLAGFAEALLLALVMSSGAPLAALVKLHHAIRAEPQKGKGASKGKTRGKGSYFDMAVSTRTNLNTTDDHGIIRVGIGFVATNFDKGLVAPLLWYLIGGLPAAYIYAGIAAARWGLSKEGFAKGFGHVPLALETIFGEVPQILSALLLALAAAFTPKASMARAVAGMVSPTGRAPYAEGGLPLTTLAWGLGVSLGGPVEDRDGSVLKRAWVGSSHSSARVDISHLRRAMYLGVMGYVLLFACLSGGIVLWRMATS